MREYLPISDRARAIIYSFAFPKDSRKKARETMLACCSIRRQVRAIGVNNPQGRELARKGLDLVADIMILNSGSNERAATITSQESEAYQEKFRTSGNVQDRDLGIANGRVALVIKNRIKKNTDA